MNPLTRLTRSYLLRHVWKLGGMFFLELAANVLTIVLALATAQAFAQLFQYGSVRGQWLVQWGLPATPQATMLFLAGLVILKMLIDFAKRWGRGLVSEYYLQDLRNALFSQHLDMTAEQYAHKDSGRFLLRFSGDLSGIQSMITRGILGFLSDLCLVLLSLAIIFWLDPGIGWLLTVFLLIFGSWLAWLNRRIGQVEEKRRNEKSNLLAYVTRQLRHIFTTKAFNQRTPALEQYQKRTRKVSRLGIQYHRWAALLESSGQLGVYVAIWLVFAWVYYRSEGGTIPPHDRLLTIGFILLSWRTTLARLLQVGLVWKKGAISWQKLALLFDRPTENWATASPAIAIPKGGSLRLAAVHLADGQGNALLRLHGQARPGELAVFIIPTGGGKTLLTQALAGLYPLQSGQILIGDVDLAQVDKKTWRRQFTYVSTAFPLHGRTIYEAIAFSKNERYRANTQEAWLSWQGIFPPLASLQLDAPLPAEAAQLSGVQYRLLLWLRAFLSDKPIWVIDDAFALLPPSMQHSLYQLIRGKKKKSILLTFLQAENQYFINELGLPLAKIELQYKK